ncbi:hypothetical protein SG0102_11390 [Intestinibaculum porci]|uniref:Uncharacterized protein n=1 Tax=Intestinibaculum porci TaxID=2487118 RepID=A0A3G9JCR2_9FIRM|nr:hypothetical protein SG0102_11390 [Intestinibaculum porci]
MEYSQIALSDAQINDKLTVLYNWRNVELTTWKYNLRESTVWAIDLDEWALFLMIEFSFV